MKCPACSRELTEIKLQSLTVSSCSGGCGGLWFDHFGLLKVEYSDAKEGETLLNIETDPNVKIDPKKKKSCPKCDMIMMHHFFSVKKQVTVDECPKCAGFWLDAGELTTIRGEFRSEAERQAATDKYFDQNFGAQQKALLEKDKAEFERVRKIRNVLGVISPSNYVRKF